VFRWDARREGPAAARHLAWRAITMENKSVVTVIGSYNVGLFLKGARLPAVGETVIGDQFHEGGGGKGSNQAVAASRLGARTRFIGRIGSDKYGNDALAMYQRLGISTDMICVDTSIHSGISVILIDKDGRNLISVIPGANFRLSREDIDAARRAITESCIVGFQLENRLVVIDYAIRKAHSWGVKTLLDPAPATKLPDDLYPCIDYIKPNETEATILSGIEVRGVASAEEAGQWFVDRGVKTAIITLGAEGAVLVAEGGRQHFRPPQVEAVDTTGAGDTFSGALMAALSKGQALEDAIVFANCAASLSVTRLGVIESIPDLAEVVALVQSSRCTAGTSTCKP
jgi:ribokinase